MIHARAVAAAIWVAAVGVAQATEVSSAVLVNYGTSTRSRCQDADEKVTDGRREAVCFTFVFAIDGEQQSRWSRLKHERQVPIGTHRLKLTCFYSSIGPEDRGAVPPIEQELELDVEFSAGRKYFTHGDVEAHVCKLRIDETPPPPPTSIWKSIVG